MQRPAAAQAKAKGKAAPTPAGPSGVLKLGCKTCRGTSKGCRACRNPNYSGPRMNRQEWLENMAMERKHRFISRIGNAIANTRQLEQSVMEEVTAKELNVLSHDTPFAALEYSSRSPTSCLPSWLAQCSIYGHLSMLVWSLQAK